MHIVPEAAIAGLMTRDQSFRAVEAVFASMARGSARNFPVIREALGHADALYGFKSGFDRDSLALGLKSGGFWPGNAAKGLTNHQSSIFLFDADTGQIKAVIGGNLLTALRTAAASAVSIHHLARPDAEVMAMVGAGHQATFQLRAALEQRKFRRVIAWNRSPDRLDRLAAVADEFGLPFEAVSLDRLGPEADVIITILSSFAPVLTATQIKPGTHLACMGTDTRGKQEVGTDLVSAARLFTDEVAQSVSIGECQHAVQAGLIRPEDIVPLGRVIDGGHPGRRAPEDITLFDGTGVALQDLAVAATVLERAIAEGSAIEV
ncbi:iminosuccinate reductase BhcD [Neotabrizicola sp. sgz301269]|uniref:iminosuccinate reductase BhcD n=1 Tax=Neotabrizicola sp. sgz301269 TaxID=3276282 RepID=UPI00376FBDEC